ncbi:MAG: right-handed parallel beta-helix repeat-containing protein [Gammaproteobacteria bacterium]|nr:right-handed parallel beta-helix repeat-containing protein [Gammaproteobacteria bacterium]
MQVVSVIGLQRSLLIIISLLITACGGGGGSSPQDALVQPTTPAAPQLFISGGGVKGPLAYASVELYTLDKQYNELYAPGKPIAAATTDAYARITSLPVPLDTQPPYILVIDGTNAIDRNTGLPPVIKKLVTIITRASLEARQPVYATPYTTLAYQMLRLDSPTRGNNPLVSLDQSLTDFSDQIVQSISFGMPSESNIFTTPPVITRATTSIAQQSLVVQHRAAIEAFSSLLYEMHLSSSTISTDELMQRLAVDLYSDGTINNSDGVQKIGGINTAILSQNPMAVTIANTKYQVKDTVKLIDDERSITGNSANVPFYTTLMSVNLKALPLATETNTLDNTAVIETSFELGYSPPVAAITETVLAASLVASGPIVIDGQQGIVISGLRISNPGGNCVVIRGGSNNIVIENSEIGPCGGKGIFITQSTNVDVRNNIIRDADEEGVMSYESSSIAVDANVIENVQSGYEMWTTTDGNLSFTNNYVKNVSRDQTNKDGGNIVQMVYVRGPGIRVTNNIGINILGKSDPEDLINVYKSSGTAIDPILISGNKFLGGGPSPSGGGIILGDQGGAFQIAENNILVNPGQYGMQIAGGNNNIIRNNQIFSDARRDFTNGGIIVWRYNDVGTGTQPGDCFGHTVVSNRVTWWKGPNYKNNGAPAARNTSWLPDYGSDNAQPNCGTVSGWNNNDFDTDNSQPANLDMSLWNTAWDNPAN